jgi:hypothetical protein
LRTHSDGVATHAKVSSKPPSGNATPLVVSVQTWTPLPPQSLLPHANGAPASTPHDAVHRHWFVFGSQTVPQLQFAGQPHSGRGVFSHAVGGGRHGGSGGQTQWPLVHSAGTASS